MAKFPLLTENVIPGVMSSADVADDPNLAEFLSPYRETSSLPGAGVTSYISQGKEHAIRDLPPTGSGNLVQTLPRYQFILKQKWVGYVIDVSNDTFLARLITIVGEGSEIEAEIFLEEVDERDHPLIRPGATFYWSIGYNDTSGRQRVSEIRFRRLSPWTPEELEAANAEAASIRALFDGE